MLVLRLKSSFYEQQNVCDNRIYCENISTEDSILLNVKLSPCIGNNLHFLIAMNFRSVTVWNSKHVI